MYEEAIQSDRLRYIQFPSYCYFLAVVHYTHLSANGSCCVAEHQEHEGCLTLNPVDDFECKLACDIDDKCKGYVVRYSEMVSERCFIATTSTCPNGSSKRNSGNVGDLDPISDCFPWLFNGCFIRQSISKTSTSGMSGI